MSNILFIAHYPFGDLIQDGMAQRIKAVDAEVEDKERTYLQLSLNPRCEQKSKQAGNLKVKCLNYISQWHLLKKHVNKAQVIYCHSLYNLKFLLGLNLSGKRVFLDIHGSVPEEQRFFGHRLKSIAYNRIERMLMPQVTDLICVSRAMADFYKNKYPSLKQNYIIKPILPINTLRSPRQAEVSELSRQIGITGNDIVFLYSGGLQKWQNFDLMVDYMNSDRFADKNFVFLVLTKQTKEAIAKLSSLNGKIRYHVESVAPDRLPEYYALAHYGFLLRDDVVLNHVAAPTKLIEYLYFGIKPIMKSLQVGDFEDLNCEYETIDSKNPNFQSLKSERNKRIADRIFCTTQSQRICEIIDRKWK